MEILEAVGHRIRMYRKLKHLSQEELAARIYKSKSAVSKYERGEANLDITTLYSIAAALEISTSDLLDVLDQTGKKPAQSRSGIFQNDTIYLMTYFKPEKFWRGVLTLHDRPDDSTGAKLYTVLPSFAEVNKCRAVFEGILLNYPTNTAILLANVHDPADLTGIFVHERKGNYHTCGGLFVQFSYITNAPAVTKTILSDVPLEENEFLEKLLLIGKDDTSNIKRTNVLCPSEYIQEETILGAEFLQKA